MSIQATHLDLFQTLRKDIDGMGILNSLNCITSDGTSFFALVPSQRRGEDTRSCSYNLLLLLKSNANPSSIDNLSWTLLSTVSTNIPNRLTDQHFFTVDDKGVFSAVAALNKRPWVFISRPLLPTLPLLSAERQARLQGYGKTFPCASSTGWMVTCPTGMPRCSTIGIPSQGSTV